MVLVAFFAAKVRGNRSNDDVDFEANEIGREIGETVGSPLCISVLDHDVLPLDPSEIAESLPKCLVPERIGGRRERRQKPNPRDFLRLLRGGHSPTHHKHQNEHPKPQPFWIFDFGF